MNEKMNSDWIKMAKMGIEDLNKATESLNKTMDTWQNKFKDYFESGKNIPINDDKELKKEAIIEYRERVKKKLQKISKGDYRTWGFVQAFFNVLDEESPQ